MSDQSDFGGSRSVRGFRDVDPVEHDVGRRTPRGILILAGALAVVGLVWILWSQIAIFWYAATNKFNF